MVFSLAPAAVISLQEMLFTEEKLSLCKFVQRIFQAFSSNFGGDFLTNETNQNLLSNKLTLYFYFVNGIIIWTSFQAKITSGLSHKIIKFPFNNLPTLTETDYFMTTTSKFAATGGKFFHATPQSIEENVYLQNMDPELSFIGNKKGLKQLLETPGRAHLGTLGPYCPAYFIKCDF